ncbi:MAG: hypothetical protein CME70_10555 [Halobacteriovorax sp.]|nr:hypothetical protein [Halobacteriovorax sp.]|tara:strand:+ start:109445 stop:110233 length:789 start_codon:yes stop_codon:yes gene_type:complete
MKKLVLMLFIFLTSCGTETAGGNKFIPSQQTSELLKVFFSSMTQLNVGVFYEPGAEPFTQSFITGKKAWDVTEDNMKALYDQRSQSVTYSIPKDLNQMTALPSQNRAIWDYQSLVELNNSLSFGSSSGPTAEFSIIYVRGTFEGNSNVIGVSLTGTTIIAIFKDVVNSMTSSETQDVKNYVEQFTVVHELGHALGLVNNGVPLTSNHHDSAHGSHCSNSSCVMNWVNEGGKEFVDFIKNYIISGRNTAFGSECLQDVRSFNP